MDPRDRRPRLHPEERRAARGRRGLPRRRDRAHRRPVGEGEDPARGGNRPGRRPRRRRLGGRLDRQPRRRIHRPRPRTDRRAPDRRAPETGDHALRRLAHGQERSRGLWFRGPAVVREGVPEPAQDPQRRRLRRLYARGAEVPQVGRHHRPAGRLRPRPHHRRLSPRRALRRRPADRGQEGARRQPRTRHARRGDPASPRGDRRADPGAEGTGRHGQVLRLRPVAAGGRCPRGDPVDLSRLSRGGEGIERRRHVARARVELPRRLCRTRLRRGHARRGGRAGADRPFRDEAAHRPFPAHARIRPALLRRSDLGHRVDRRHGDRRTASGHQVELPLPAHARDPRPGARSRTSPCCGRSACPRASRTIAR